MRYLLLLVMACVLLTGCVTGGEGQSSTGPSVFPPLTEPAWIRNGEPMVMENNTWYPTDEVESLLDAEVYPVGQYRDVTVFIERTDVKPYARLYTSFAKNRYRAFEPHDDTGL